MLHNEEELSDLSLKVIFCPKITIPAQNLWKFDTYQIIEQFFRKNPKTPSEGHMLRLKICAFFALILAKKALFWAVLAQIPGLPIILGSLCGWSLFILIFPIKSEVHF